MRFASAAKLDSHEGTKNTKRIPLLLRAFVPSCERAARGPVSRVLSSAMKRLCDHSSRRRVAPPLQQPTRAASRNQAPEPKLNATPIRSCSRWGLPCRSCCQGRGALLPHPFDLTRPKPGGVLSVALSLMRFAEALRTAGRYPAPWFHGARTFLAPRFRGGRGRPALWQGRYRRMASSLRVRGVVPALVGRGSSFHFSASKSPGVS